MGKDQRLRKKTKSGTPHPPTPKRCSALELSPEMPSLFFNAGELLQMTRFPQSSQTDA